MFAAQNLGLIAKVLVKLLEGMVMPEPEPSLDMTQSLSVTKTFMLNQSVTWQKKSNQDAKKQMISLLK